MVELDCETLLPCSESTQESEPRQRLIPRHPATWHLDSSAASVPAFAHTSAAFSHPDGIRVEWNSRAHRKGRCPKLITGDGKKVAFTRPPLVLLNLDLQNPSWWVGFLFFVGSALWCVHGALLMLDEKTEVEYYFTSWSALIGILLFDVGAYMATLEALNADPTIKLSYILVKDDPEAKYCTPGDCHWTARAVCSKTLHSAAHKGQPPPQKEETKVPRKYRYWGWEPENVGFLSNFMVFVGAVVFTIPCIVGYHSVADRASPAVINALFWTPQVLASVLFVVAPTLGMLEMQDAWYKIKPLDLGWQSCFNNFIGGWGFLAAGVTGYWYAVPGVFKWGVGFSTLWGSVAFLVGSGIVWFEVMNPYDATL